MAHNDEGAKIFVGGIGETGEDELKNYFGQYGNVKAVQVKYDPTTQRARGFGFIIFDDMSSVDSMSETNQSASPAFIDDRLLEPATVPHGHLGASRAA